MMDADHEETWQSEVWGVVLDDHGSTDYNDTLYEARLYAGEHSAIVHVVTYTVAANGD